MSFKFLRPINVLALALAVFALAACAGPQAVRGRLHWGMDDAPEGRHHADERQHQGERQPPHGAGTEPARKLLR